ncbi:hypothetical protein [Actinomadura alba]|uniref:ATP-binding protein n=1 Tax=Actinomadura alba TaxID=406431 RepID=A0ABR7LV85_9ACTN|nr:hypothetical protein [Actinomadura alba]MBC6468671.1 hypothetical protein [Actinomadura alba]
MGELQSSVEFAVCLPWFRELFSDGVDQGGAQTMPRVIHDLYAESGRGLLLVKAVAEEWGMEPDGGGGTCTWFELEL